MGLSCIDHDKISFTEENWANNFAVTLHKSIQQKYQFLDTNLLLGSNIILLGYGGSIAYGTNIPTSDIDIRGIAVRSAQDIISNKNFDQVENSETDTVIYSLEKIFKLLSNCNPNVIELLGLKPEHYIYANKYGKEILANKDIFLSKIACYSFGGYATAQLRRLDNKSARDLQQAEQEQHILNSIQHAKYHFENKYPQMDKFEMIIDKSEQEDMDSEIFLNVSLNHYPARDYLGMWSEIKDIIKSYNTLGKRNSRAIEKENLGKHMMHLVRLYLMAFDILEKKQIVTYREKEHDFLMAIRNGKYLNGAQPTEEFRELINEYEKRLHYAEQNTDLPDKPNYKQIDELLYSINKDIVKNYLNL